MKERKDNRYQVQVDLGKDENGKRIRKTVYGSSPKEAKKKADAVKLAYGKGVTTNLSIEQWIDAFLVKEKFKSTETNYKAKKSKLDIFKANIDKNIKAVEVKPFLLQNFFATLVSNGRSVKTIKEYKSVLNQLFSFIFVNGGIVNNPCDYVELPKGKPKKQRRALTSEEQIRIANLPNDIYPGKAMALVCMWAGLRRGEATALLWSDIDFKNSTIRVNKSYDFKQGELKETKTEAGMRLVPLLPCLANYLKTLPKTSPYVFGKRLEQWEWHKAQAHILRYLEKEYGNPKATPKTYKNKYTMKLTIPYFSWHELRHTYCTILYDNDIPLKVAMVWMGHKSQEMTAEIYSHLSAEKEKTAKETILTYGSQMVVNGSV